VHASEAGLTAYEAGDLIGLRPSSFLWSVHSHPEIKREKYQGRYVYLSSKSARHAEQLQNRLILPQTQRLPSEYEAIAILVEKIKHPQWSVENLANKLKAKNMFIDPHVIEDLFLRHGLVTKKNDL
jgi:hypothetical protein